MEEMILQDICKIYDCPHTTAKDEGVGIPLVRTPNVGKGRLVLTNVHRVNSDVYKKRTLRAIPEEDDIIIAREAPVGNAAIIQKKQKVCLGQRVVLLKPNKALVDPNFLVYYLLSNEVQHHLKIHANGAVVAHLNVADIRNLSVCLPSLCEQKKIGKSLKIIDDKIELNRRINDNLEQQAQALFKSWFVEKPNPQWTKGSLSDIASFVGGYSYKGDELVDSSNTGMATIKNYNRSGGFKTDGFKAINPSDKVKNAQYAELFEILVAHTDLTQNAEVIGNAELVLSLGEYNKIIFSMDLVKVLPSSSFPYRFLIAAMLKNKLFKGHCQGYVNGTTVLHLNKKALPEYKVMIPTDTEAKKMNEILGGYYKRMSENLKENDMLEQLRDTILPKLMSGELKINDLNC